MPPSSLLLLTTELKEIANDSTSRCIYPSTSDAGVVYSSRQFVKLVSDGMEDETIFGEKQSIRDSARALKKYGSISGGGSGSGGGGGSCRSPALTSEALIRHDVDKTDTLQGIALKYGCSVSNFFKLFLFCPSSFIHR